MVVWGCYNSDALVLEELWASGLVKYPQDPASEGTEFNTRPQSTQFNPVIKGLLLITHGEKYHTEALFCEGVCCWMWELLDS